MSSHELHDVPAPSDSTIADNTDQPKSRSRSYKPESWDARADLRRKQRRDYAELVVSRSDLLQPEDAALLRAVFMDGKSIAEVALLARLSVARLRRHVHKLLRRVLSPHFEFVVRNCRAWEPERRRVAHQTVVLGAPLRKAATDLKMSLHTVRGHHQSIRTLFEESCTRRAAVITRLRRPEGEQARA